MALLLHYPARSHGVERLVKPPLLPFLQHDLDAGDVVDEQFSGSRNLPLPPEILDKTGFRVDKFGLHLLRRGKEVLPGNGEAGGPFIG